MSVPSVWRRGCNGFARRRELWRAWRRTSPAERVRLLKLAALIPAMAQTVHVIGFRRLRTTLARLSPVQAGTRNDDMERLLERALRRAARYAPYRGNCLSQSLALWWLLRREGVDAELCLGARMDEAVFSAHAWVECAGRALNDAPDVRQRFAPFERTSVTQRAATS